MFRYLTTWAIVYGAVTAVRIIADNAKAAGLAEGTMGGYAKGWADAKAGDTPFR